jgi:hypothetical protein
MTIRERFTAALSGEVPDEPIYAVYDWFVRNRPHVRWHELFDLGLGQINHANVIQHEHPNYEIVEETSDQNGTPRRDVRIVTDIGELHEWYLGEWRHEYLIKSPADYRIMMHALDGVRVRVDDTAYEAAEAAVGERGITLGQIAGLGRGRTPLMVLQIDWVGLEQFSIDLALEQPYVHELLELMNTMKLEEVRAAAASQAPQIKLWENLSIETMGPALYRRYLMPLYRRILPILEAAGKRMLVHYDGNLQVIARDIAGLAIDGIDSFTEPPEGDMSVADARAAWPEKFLWVHPNLGWYEHPEALPDRIRRVVREAGPTRYCLMISEEVPPNWERTIPMVLETLQERG